MRQTGHGLRPDARRLAWLALVFILFGCNRHTPLSPTSDLPWLTPPDPLPRADDLDRDSLRLALQRSLAYLDRLPTDRALPFGDRQVSVAALQETLKTFQHLVATSPTSEALAAAVARDFERFQAAGRDGHGKVLFTGYHEIVLAGSRQPSPAYPYPIYTRPPDLVTVDLGLFHPRYQGERLVARLVNGSLLPYYTRQEIDVDGKLRGRGLELAWLRDAVDGFFLHIEGSGQIHLPDGDVLYVNYAASNGQPYRSIGRMLVDEGRLTPDELSLQGLRRYFRTHPEERPRVLSANPRYIFFRQVDKGPIGSLGLPLVPGRSIATDARLFPPAGLAVIQTQKPVFDARGKITGWTPFSRFVLNHDTGSAITGPGRVDLFWGSDALAETAAGQMKHHGKLFFLLKRQAVLADRGDPAR